MISFSIIICTHNPDETVLNRLFLSIVSQEIGEYQAEIILVDNNSDKPVNAMSIFKEFSMISTNLTYIREMNPGLTAARIAGINSAKFEWLIFFDDDNEPEINYLNNACKAINEFPKVGAWGPAEVNVDYLGEISNWNQNIKRLFQFRKDCETIFDNKSRWQNCYPFGTGLIIKKQIALIYTNRIVNQQYNLTDRKGKSLSSGGDIQLVLTAIDHDYFAGIYYGLKINHLILSKKTKLKYLQRLQYSTASVYVIAHNEVFLNNQIYSKYITNKEVLKSFIKCFELEFKQSNYRFFLLKLAENMGRLNAYLYLQSSNSNKPLLLKLYEIYLGV